MFGTICVCDLNKRPAGDLGTSPELGSKNPNEPGKGKSVRSVSPEVIGPPAPANQFTVVQHAFLKNRNSGIAAGFNSLGFRL
jgi:hypothetical protein